MQWYDTGKFLPPPSQETEGSIPVLVADEYYRMLIGFAVLNEDNGDVYWIENDRLGSVIHHPISWSFLPMAGSPGDLVTFPSSAYLPGSTFSKENYVNP